MINNLKGYNNRLLLEEVGLINRMKVKGRNFGNKVKIGTQGFATGFGVANDVANMASGANKAITSSKEKDTADGLISAIDNSNNIFKRINPNSDQYKNFSDDEKKIFNRSQMTGYMTNSLGRLGLLGGGIYGAKKLYDHYTETPMDKAHDAYNDAYDNVHDTYDDIVN